MLAIGNEELEDAPNIGKTIHCTRCGQRHRVEYGDKVEKDGTKTPSKLLAFVRCQKNTYLVGINGKDIRRKGK